MLNPTTEAVAILTVAVATPSDCTEVTELLRDSYSRSPDFIVQEDSYFEDHFAGRCAVLIVRSEGQLISTMRANLISCSADIGYEDQGRLTDQLVPALHLSRAATIRDSHTRGVNSMMRLFCLETALSLGLQSLTGYVYQEASRTRLMSELGYRFSALSDEASPCFSDRTQGLFASLLLAESGQMALSVLRSQPINRQYSVVWEGNSLERELLRA